MEGTKQGCRKEATPPCPSPLEDPRLTPTDLQLFRTLVDLRTVVGKHNPVKGGIVSILANHENRTILSWGFVRSMTGSPLRAGKRKRAGNQTDIHAEADALTALFRSPPRQEEMNCITAYISSVPCQVCFAMLVNAGISRIVYPQPKTAGYYQTHRSQNAQIASSHGVQVLETTMPLPPYRPIINTAEFMMKELPDLPRAWAGGRSPFVEAGGDNIEGNDDNNDACFSATKDSFEAAEGNDKVNNNVS